MEMLMRKRLANQPVDHTAVWANAKKKKCVEKIMHKLKLHKKADGEDDLC